MVRTGQNVLVASIARSDHAWRTSGVNWGTT
jgi:hypothetical protein